EVGIIASATGSGKTRLIEEIVLLRKVKTLVIVPSISVRTGVYNDLVKAFGRRFVSTKYPKLDEREQAQKAYDPMQYKKISTMDPELLGAAPAEDNLSAFEKRMLKRSQKNETPKTGRIGGGMAEFYGTKKAEDAYLEKKG